MGTGIAPVSSPFVRGACAAIVLVSPFPSAVETIPHAPRTKGDTALGKEVISMKTVVQIVISAELDTGYLHAVGSDPKESARLFVREIFDVVCHEDWGSTIDFAHLKATLKAGRQPTELITSTNTDAERGMM